MLTALSASALATTAAAHPHDPETDLIFAGGGWGHGVGLSQYGALGRAEAGITHDQILAFYYEGTRLVTDPGLVPDDVDVRIAVHNTTVFYPSGLLTLAMDGRYLDTTRNTLTIRRGDGGWYINSSNIDWCRGFCTGTNLTVSFDDGSVVRVSSTTNGAERFAHGQFQLTPAAPGISNCGSRTANQYCLVIGDMTMQQYLYGLDEVPSNWPAEALKAQVIAARSYAAAIMAERTGWDSPFDLYASTRDQEYKAWDFEREQGHELWKAEVDATDDTVLTYKQSENETAEVIVAYYSSSNGGHTAANSEPRTEDVAYLQAKSDEYDAATGTDGRPQNNYHSWHRSYSKEQISRWLAEYPFADLDVGTVEDVSIAGAGPSGRIDDALVTVVGSDKTVEVRNSDGDPYGYRFYYALVLGCRNTDGCAPLLSTKLALENELTDNPVRNLPFTDISRFDPYAEAVSWMYHNQITSGTTATTFSPERMLTRAQFATFLWRFAGRPEVADGSATFSDVEPGSHHAAAVGWMLTEGITTGCATEPVPRFCGDQVLKGSHIAAFLWRFAGRAYSSHTIPFNDIGINDYYLEAARWMVQHRIWVDEAYQLAGTGPVAFDPDEGVSRARMAMFVWSLAGSREAFGDVELPSLLRTQ